MRKNLGFITGFENFNVNANVSIIESQQEFNQAERENRESQLREGETLPDNRQLQGQSPFLINLGINYEGQDDGWKAGFFYNTQGRTLQLVAEVQLFRREFVAHKCTIRLHCHIISNIQYPEQHNCKPKGRTHWENEKTNTSNNRPN